MTTFRSTFLVIILPLFVYFTSFAQSNVATVGKEFWLGFMQNGTAGSGEQLKIFVTSTFNTTGVLSIPTTGYTQNFTVVANQTTELILSNSLGEHYQSNIIENKGVLIETANDVSVFYLNSQPYSTDGTKVLPYLSLGSLYRLMAAPGISGYSEMRSEFLVVATQDDTEIEIITSVNTVGGPGANVPFTIQLDRGESYQLQAVSPADLTGTTITATANSGNCRPFAVFSGSMCSFLPSDCYACDHVCDQNLPIEAWNKEYIVIPFLGPSQFMLKVLAHENNSVISKNGTIITTLAAGQYYTELDNGTTPSMITSNKNVSVAQLMTGTDCSGDMGDPAMMLLNSSNQFINSVTFSTAQSAQITSHHLNIITKTPFTNQISLDGTALGAGVFSVLPSNPVFSYARVNITAGSHTIIAPNGIQAYIYGFGNSTYETYAYSLGASIPQEIVEIDTVLCSSDSITIGNNESLYDTWWSNALNPNDTILSGTTYYSLLPTSPQLYTLHGNEFVSGCPTEFLFSVEAGTSSVVTITASTDTTCLYQPVQLNGIVDPPGAYNYQWSPAIGLSDPTISNPIATIPYSIQYTLEVTSAGGCTNTKDSISLVVNAGSITNFSLSTANDHICIGDTAHISVLIESIQATEVFDSGVYGSFSGSNNGVGISSACSSFSGNSLVFNGTGIRSFTTVDQNLTAGGNLKFSILSADTSMICDETEIGDDLVLEYSTNGGSTWSIVQTYYEYLSHSWTEITVPIPVLAQTAATRFRWRQTNNNGVNTDIWQLDNIFLSVMQSSGYAITWTPTSNLQSSNQGMEVNVAPPLTTTYIASYLDGVTGCYYSDSITIFVGQNFDLTTTDDIFSCESAPFQLQTQVSIPGNYTYQWTPSLHLNDDQIANPLVLSNLSQTYYVTVESEFECSRFDSVQINVGELYNFVLSPQIATLCLGDTLQNTLEYTPLSCILASTNGSSTQTGIVGTSTTYSGVVSYSPFTSSLSVKRQYIITKSEMNAMGFTSIGKIASLAMNIANVGGTGQYQQFTMKVACTNLTSLGVDFIPNLEVVKNPSTLTLVNGWNTFVFDQQYVWDGVSNIVVEMCFENPSIVNSSSVYYSISTSGGVYSYGNSVCGNLTGTFTSYRPNMKVGFSATSATNNLSYIWTPTTNISDIHVATPIFSPQVSTTYYVTATDTVTNCVFNDSIVISVAPNFQVLASPDITSCSIQGETISVSHTSPSPVSFLWSPAASLSDETIQSPVASPLSTTTYIVSAISQEGCQKQDTVIVTINSLNSFAVSPSNEFLCLGDSLSSSLYFAPVTCQLGAPICTSPQTVTVGTSVSTSSSTNTSPFNSYQSSKRQYIFTQSELALLGLTGVNTIKSLAFDVTSIGGTGIYDNFTIKVGCTALSTLTGTFLTTTQIVKQSNTIQLVTGLNTFQFDQGYVWDGVSNLLVEICYTNTFSTSSSSVMYTSTPNANLYCYGADVCSQTTGYTTTYRPVVKFGYCAVDTTNSLSYAWLPTTNISAVDIAEPLFYPDVNTTYYVTATDAVSGCIYTDSVQITVAPAFDLTVSSDVTVCSITGTPLSASTNSNSTVSYEWSPSSYLSDFTSSNPIATPLTSTVYTVAATSQEGCLRTDSVEIAIQEFHSFNVTPDTDTICIGNTIQSAVDFTVLTCMKSSSLCVSPQTVVVGTSTNSSSSSSISPFVSSYLSTKHQYIFSQTELAALGMVGAQKIQSIALNVSTLGMNSSFQNFTIKMGCTTLTSLNSQFVQNLETVKNPATVILSSVGWNTFLFDESYNWDGVSNIVVEICFNNTSYSPSSSLYYSVAPSSQLYYYGSSVCSQTSGYTTYNRPNVKFGYCALQTVNNLTYVWSPNNDITAIDIAEPVFSPTQNTTYTVVATDSISGCTFTDSMVVIVIGADSLGASAGPDVYACSTENYQLGVSSPFSNSTYTWTPSNMLNNAAVANPIMLVDSTVVFVVAVQDQQNCGAIYYDTITITSVGSPVLTISTNLSVCAGDSIQLIANTSAGSILWSNAPSLTDSAINNPLAFPLNSTYYSVTVTDTIGCVSTDSVFVVVDHIPVINLDVDTAKICLGESVVLDAGSGLANYLWSNNSTQQTLSVNTTGNYWVETTNACGVPRDSVYVLVNLAPVIELGNDTTLCLGDSIVLVADPASNLSCSWSTLAVSDSILVVMQNLYSVTVTNEFGCVETDSIYVQIAPLPLMDLGATTQICEGDSLSLSPGNFTSYSWSTGAVTSTIVTDSAGIYSVAVADANGCENTEQISISISLPPVFAFGSDINVCEGQPVSLTTNSNLQQTWSTGVSNVNTISVSSSGDYWVTLYSANQCSVTDSIHVNFNSLPTLQINALEVVCTGDSLQLVAVSNASTFLWSNPLSSFDDVTISQPWAVPSSSSYYGVTVIDGNNCSSSDSIYVQVLNIVSIELGIDSIDLCKGESIQLDPGSGYGNYVWSDNSTEQQLLVNYSGTIWVQTVNLCGVSRDTVQVTVHDLPLLKIDPVYTVCLGDSVQLIANTNGTIVNWLNPTYLSNPNVSQPWASPIVDLSYTVTVFDSLDCSTTGQTMVAVYPVPDVQFKEDTLYLCEKTTTDIHAGIGFDSYNWQDGSIEESFHVMEAGLYWVMVENSCGSDYDSVLVVMEDCQCMLYIPNTFTPDGGKYNNEFIPVTNCDYTYLDFRIYNRWGETIFETSDAARAWDGSFNGYQCQDGVYSYVIYYKFEEYEAKIINGTITLLR